MSSVCGSVAGSSSLAMSGVAGQQVSLKAVMFLVFIRFIYLKST